MVAVKSINTAINNDNVKWY